MLLSTSCFYWRDQNRRGAGGSGHFFRTAEPIGPLLLRELEKQQHLTANRLTRFRKFYLVVVDLVKFITLLMHDWLNYISMTMHVKSIFLNSGTEQYNLYWAEHYKKVTSYIHCLLYIIICGEITYFFIFEFWLILSLTDMCVQTGLKFFGPKMCMLRLAEDKCPEKMSQRA